MSECRCFSDGNGFRDRYMETMQKFGGNAHEAEKTFPTIKKWAEGKCFRDYRLIPFYADHDYCEYMCAGEGANQVMCATTRMTSLIRVNTIQKTLDEISVDSPGKCCD